jgi:hypothetical protein
LGDLACTHIEKVGIFGIFDKNKDSPVSIKCTCKEIAFRLYCHFSGELLNITNPPVSSKNEKRKADQSQRLLAWALPQHKVCSIEVWGYHHFFHRPPERLGIGEAAHILQEARIP